MLETIFTDWIGAPEPAKWTDLIYTLVQMGLCVVKSKGDQWIFKPSYGWAKKTIQLEEPGSGVVEGESWIGIGPAHVFAIDEIRCSLSYAYGCNFIRSGSGNARKTWIWKAGPRTTVLNRSSVS